MKNDYDHYLNNSTKNNREGYERNDAPKCEASTADLVRFNTAALKAAHMLVRDIYKVVYGEIDMACKEPVDYPECLSGEIAAQSTEITEIIDELGYIRDRLGK